jgi:SpoVK/Ycf46/Vps4 family AAA+-type ATPase
MVHIGGAGTRDDDRILIIGATNRPFELDDAVRRRLEKRLYVPLPTKEGREQFIKNLVEKERHETKIDISEEEIQELVSISKGYSGADLKSLCTEASLIPVREQIEAGNLETMSSDDIRAVALKDMVTSLQLVKPSVNQRDLAKYLEWNKDFGSYQLEQAELDT